MYVVDVTKDKLEIRDGDCPDKGGEVLVVFNCHRWDEDRTMTQGTGVPESVQAAALTAVTALLMNGGRGENNPQG